MSESMRKLITLVESMDTQSPMTMSDFVRSAKQNKTLCYGAANANTI